MHKVFCYAVDLPHLVSLKFLHNWSIAVHFHAMWYFPTITVMRHSKSWIMSTSWSYLTKQQQKLNAAHSWLCSVFLCPPQYISQKDLCLKYLIILVVQLTLFSIMQNHTPFFYNVFQNKPSSLHCHNLQRRGIVLW